MNVFVCSTTPPLKCVSCFIFRFIISDVKYVFNIVLVSTGSVLGNMPPSRYLPGGSHREGASGGNQPLCWALHEEFRLHQGTDPPVNLEHRPLRDAACFSGLSWFHQIIPHYTQDNHPCLEVPTSCWTQALTLAVQMRFCPRKGLWWLCMAASRICYRDAGLRLMCGSKRWSSTHSVFLFYSRWHRRSWKMPSWHVAG